MKTAFQIRLAAAALATGVLILLAAYWAELFATHERARQGALESAAKHSVHMSDAIAEQANLLLGSVGGALQRLREQYKTGGIRALDRSATDVIGNFPPGAILQIALIDSRGFLAYSNLGQFDRVFLGDREHFLAHTERSDDPLFVSKPVIGRTSGKASIQVTRPIRTAGRLDGVLVASVNPKYLADEMASLRLHADDVIALFHASDGSYLVRVPEDAETLTRKVPKTHQGLANSSRQSGHFRADSSYDQIPRTYGWTRVTRFPLIASVGFSEPALLEDTENRISLSMQRNVIGTVLVVALTFGVIVLLLRTSRQQSRLTETETRFRTIVETSLDAIVVLDPDHRIVVFNPAAERLFGVAGKDMSGQPLDRLIPERFRHAHPGHINQFAHETGLARPMGRTRKVFGLRSDGSEFPIEVSISRAEVDGRNMFTALIRDISIRQAAEDNLRASEQRFRDLVNTTDGIVWEADAKSFQFTFVSDKAEAVLGFPPENWLQPGFWVNHLHPDDRSWAPEYCAACTRRAEAHNFEYRFVARDGRTVWLKDIVTVVTEAGEPRWLRGIMVDITNSKIADIQRAEAEARWRFALEGSGQGVWDWNVTSSRVTYSPLWKSLIGYDADEIGEDFSEWERRLHPDDRAGALEAVQKTLRGETPYFESEHRLRHKDGGDRWILGRGMVVARNADGQPLRMVGTASDITAQKALAQQLRDEGRRTRQIISSAREGIIVYGPDLRYQVWNPFMEMITGHTEAEVLGRHPLEVFPFLKDGGVIERLQRALAGETPEAVEFPFEVEQTGLKGWVSDQCAPLRDANDLIIGVIGTVHGITRIKEAENRLREINEELESRVSARTVALVAAADRAEAASRAKTAFLANMSHEMRTPMTAIIGMSELMARDALSPAQAERLHQIDSAAQHLLGIINDLLDLARIEAGKLTLSSDEIRASELVEEAIDLVRERAGAKGLEIRAEIGKVSDALFGDRLRLRQCLLNYLSNAVKFTERGQIIVRVFADDAPPSPGRRRLRIEVADTGPGIAAAVAHRLFNKFEQGDNSMTREHGGTGLGLAIVRQLARLMQGDAGVNSVEGQGSVFWFTCELDARNVPQARQAESIGSIAGASAGSGLDHPGDRRILVVDDHQANLDVVIAAMEMLGVPTDTAVDGEQAVLRVSQTRYDLVLMDLHLPRMSGLEATREIRRRYPGLKLPILGLTGDSPVAVATACLSAGMNGVIGKPFHIDDLLARVRQAIENPEELENTGNTASSAEDSGASN